MSLMRALGAHKGDDPLRPTTVGTAVTNPIQASAIANYFAVLRRASSCLFPLILPVGYQSGTHEPTPGEFLELKVSEVLVTRGTRRRQEVAPSGP